MNEETFDLTSEQRRRLLAKLPKILYGGGHLTDDDFINYALGSAAGEEQRHTAAHLEECEACAEEMAAFMSGTEAWRGEEGERRLAALSERLESAIAGAESATRGGRPITLWGQFGDWMRRLNIPNPFMQSLQPQPQFRTLSEFPPYLTEDRLLGVSFVEEQSGNLSVYVDSYILDFDGRRVRVEASSASWEETLRRIDVDQLSAVIKIPRHERRLLANCSELSVSLVQDDSAKDRDDQRPEV